MDFQGPLGRTEVKGKRLLRVTAGNLQQSHLYVREHFDFFPQEAFGPARRNGSGGGIEIVLDGLDETVRTDIGRDAKTGKPRHFLRGRDWVRKFYEHHQGPKESNRG